jgi:hypothetical protein
MIADENFAGGNGVNLADSQRQTMYTPSSRLRHRINKNKKGRYLVSATKDNSQLLFHRNNERFS